MRPRAVAAFACTVAALTLGSTVAIAAAAGGLRDDHAVRAAAGPRSARSTCAAPRLPGAVVDVTLVDMHGSGAGSMTGGPMMGGAAGRGPMMGGAGAMRLFASPVTVAHGTVSFVALNAGSIDHELVVLPLRDGAAAGTRAVGDDGSVDERSSLGEASNACGAGAGDGIAPGSAGWVTLTLAPGRYELVCNLAGHYASGMYAVLTVS